MNDNPFRFEPSWPRDSMCAMTGSPRSRERTESIRSTLLGRVSGLVRCPRVIRLGLRFEKGDDPVTVITNMLAEDGFLGP